MTTRFIREGKTFNHQSSVAVASGDVVVEGALAGVATDPIEADGTGTVAISGVFALPADEATAFGLGANLAWDVSAEKLILNSSAAAGDVENFGKAVEAKEAATGEADVLLTPEVQAIK